MSCFWTNLVQTEQQCEAAAPGEAVVQFISYSGSGSSFGGFRIELIPNAPGDGGVCAAALDTLFGAESIVITGYAAGDIDELENAACSDPVPSSGYTDVSWEMVLNPFEWSDGEWWYGFDSSEAGPEQGLYYARILVDGTTTLFGILSRGGGV